MKNLITYLKTLWSRVSGLESTVVSLDCRLTVDSPSFHRRSTMLKLVSVLVLILTVGSGNAWGTTFTTTNSGGFTGTNKSKTTDGITVTFSSDASWQSDHVRVYQNGTISFSSSSSITGITLNCVSTGSYPAREFNANTGSCSVDGDATKWSGSGTSITLTLPSGKQVRISSIVVETGAAKTLSSIAITTQPTRRKYVVGETFSSTGAVVTATYSDASTKSVSATWTPTSALSAGTGQTVTASYTEGGVNKTATTTVDVYSITLNAKDESNNVLGALIVTQPTQSGSSLTAAATGNSYTFKQWSVSGASLNDNSSTTPTITAVTGAVTATAVYYAPITVEWYAGGTKIDEETHARGWSLMYPSNPDPATYGCAGKEFYGWTTEANKNYEHATVAPSLVSSGTAINENVKYYAVFAESSGGGGVTTTWVLTALNAVTEGTYALLTDDGHAFNGTFSSGHGQITAQAFSFTDGVATSAPTGTCEVTFTAVTGGFTMSIDAGYLYASKAASGGFATHATESEHWSYTSSNWQYSKDYSGNKANLRSYSNNSFRTYSNNSGALLKLAKKTTSGSEPTWSNFATSCGCEEYSFHTGSSADETLKTTNTQTCFEDHPSDANQRIISDYVIPADTKFFVGKLGYFYNSNLNISGTGSQSVIKQFGAANADNGLYLNYTKGYGDGSRPGVGQATGAIGTLYIDVTSTWHNLHLGFDPNGYIFKLGSTYLTMHNATSGLDATRYKETDVVTLSSTNISGQFQVNIAAVAPNASTGVACAYTETKNLTTMGVKSGSGNNWRATSISNAADANTKGFFRIDVGEGNATNWNAHWVPCWELTFNLKEGTGTIATTPAYVSVEAASKVVQIPTTAPTKDGYRFMGWSDDDNNTVEYAAGSTHNVTLSGNKTVYAVWAQEYTVTYAYAGGSGSCAGGNYISGETVTTCASATKAGSTLTGWLRSDNSATVTPGNTFTMPASNVTLTAVWEDTEYTLTQTVGSHTTKGHTGTTITSGMTSPSGLDLTYSISNNSYALPKTVTISGGGQTWTLGTNYTWTLSEDKHSATLHIGSDLTITANVTVTVAEQARYTVVWNEHGSTTTEYYAADNNSVTMKTGIADCGSKKFYCWTEDAEFVSDDDTPPAAATFGTISGNKTYYAIFADAVVPLSPGYTKITSGVTAGTYLISTDGGTAYAGRDGSNSYGTYTSVTVSAGTIASKGSAQEVTITMSSSNFYMNDGTYYLGYSGSSNDLKFNTSVSGDNRDLWKLDANGQIESVNVSGRKLEYNSGSPRFACYTGSGVDAFLYKKETTTYEKFSKTCATYDITIDPGITGGMVTTTPTAGTDVAGEGQEITVNVTPNSCKYLSALKYNDGSDHAISIASTPYTFEMPEADVTVTATFADKTVSSISAITSDHRILMQGSSFVGEQIRVTYNNGETEDLAWNDATLSFSGYNMATINTYTVTVNYTGTCGNASTTYSMEVSDGIPITFSDCGITSTTKYQPGDAVPVETTSGAYACSGWEFVGWSATAVANNSTSFTPVRNFNASTARTLYAVYAHLGSTFTSAKLTSELREGARYILAYYVNNNDASYGLTGLLPTAKNTNYLQGTHTGNSGIAYTETNVGGLYQYTLTSYTPVTGVLWQLQADGTGYWQLYNISQRKYLNLSSYSDGYVSVSTSPVGKLVLEDEDANPAYCNGSRVYVKYNGGTKRLAWNRNSGDGYWNQHTSGYQFFLTKDEYFSSTPPCAPRSVTFHGNGGTVIAKTGTPTGADLEITEASRDAGIYLPTAETDAEDCDGKVWSFIGWIDHEVDLTRVPILTTDLLNDGYDPLDPNPHYDIIADDEEYWAVYTNTGDPETKYGTISFTKVDFDQQYSSDEKTITKTVSEVGDYTFGYKRVGHQSSIGIQFENGTGEFYNKTSLGKVTSISFTTFNVGAITNLKVYVGDEEKSTTNELTASDLQVVGSTYTYYPRQNCGYVYIKDYNAYVNIGTITVNFGQGTEVWATTPDCSILSLSGTVRVTSTSGKKVKAVTPLTISGHGLAANAAVSFAAYNVSDDTPNSHFTFIGSASADINGDVSSTEIVVAYQPTETTDGVEEVYFIASATASNGSSTTESNKQSGYGRHLPAKFVIATKIGDDWYALPNNITTASYGARDIIPIIVDNATTPTTATVYNSTTDYLAWGMNAAGTSTDRYTTDGEKISFVSAINSKGLAGNASGLRNSAALPATTSEDYLLFDWKPSTTDLGNYTLQNGSVTTYYVATNGSDKWTTATTGADVRFLAYDKQPAPTITWQNDMLESQHAQNTAENALITLPTGDDPVSCNTTLLPTFCGWKDGQIATYTTVEPTYVQEGDVVTTDKTYYAVFKEATRDRWYTSCPTYYTITYTANGGTGSNYVTYTMNTTADAVTVETAGFTKEGSTFVGWTNPADLEGTLITPGTGKITGLSGDITLNAVWMGTVSVTGTVRLTASAGEKVATSGTEVTISSTDFACATALRITYKDVTNDVTYGRSGSPTYTSSEFRLCNGSYGSADGDNIDLTAVSGAYNQTFSITYEPNGGANTLDEYQLKVEVLLKNTVIDTKTLSLYGRTLPASFAIAIKAGGSWYALPNNMGSEGTYDPILISVTEDVSVLNWSAQGPPTVAYKMKDYTPNYSKLRFAANDATEYCLWAATGNAAGIRNYSASSTDNNYAWTVTSDASFNAYTMANLANTREALKIYNNKWEMYNTGGLSEIHFIPLTTVTPIDVTVMEWGVDEIAVKIVANWTPSAITAQISGGSPSTVTKTAIGGDLYKLTGVGDLQGNPGEPLALNVTDGSAKQAILQIPFIVTDTKTEAQLATILKDAGYAATLPDARNLTKNMDVIVRSGGTLSSESSTSGTFQNIYIYPGGKADFSKNISIQNIYMRGGFSWLGGAYAHPQMNVASTASISGIGSTGHGIFYDLYLDNSIYYVFALPKDVAVTAITNEENGDDWDAWIKSYSGKGRTLSPKVSGWNYVTSGSIARGAGYEIAIKPRLSRPYGILRFPLLKSTAWSTETDCSPEVTAWGMTAGELNDGVSANNAGWNFIGNPFLTAYNNEATPGSSPSGLIQTKTLVPTDTDPWDGKYQWATSNVKYFTVPRYTEYEYDDVRAYPYKLDAFFPFFIQATGDGTVTFDDANKALKTPARYAGEPVREVFVDFQLSNSNGQSDVAGLTISNQYSDAFDMNDKEKTIQNGNSAMKVYTLVGEFRTAFNALTEATAALPIPVGIIAPTAGTYRFAKLEDADYSEVEHLWLTDYTQSSLVDLLVEPFYEFTTEAGRFEDRFAINATLAPKQDTPTDIDGTSEEIDQPIKFIYHDKMYIMRGGVIYDATGKRVREINK